MEAGMAQEGSVGQRGRQHAVWTLSGGSEGSDGDMPRLGAAVLRSSEPISHSQTHTRAGAAALGLSTGSAPRLAAARALSAMRIGSINEFKSAKTPKDASRAANAVVGAGTKL